LNVNFIVSSIVISSELVSKSPEHFRFSVKTPKAITHFKQFHDVVPMISDFYETINNGLKEKSGPVLFQMPLRFIYDGEG
jgi:uncharacterized protein YecE (DUF72 family)